MAEYRYYLIPDFMSHVFPQQFEAQAPTDFFSNTADLMKRYQQLREMPYNNEYTWNERTNLPYPRLTVGIDRHDPDGAVTIMQVRNGIQCFKRGCYVEPEHPQPGDKLDRLMIYQIPHYTCEYRFTDYDYAQNKLKATDYHCAYVANMPRDYTPDKCFRDFNYDDRPCANSMPSLSVSDLIVMEHGDKAEALYVDAVGFKDVSRLLPELHDMEVERQEHNLDELER